MATVITVHGTNDSGPVQGDHWWQKTSSLDEELGKWVQGRDGAVTFEPFVWTGENSEHARFEAGQRLAARLSALEAAREPYCVVCHSHGGSSTLHAFHQMVASGTGTNYLRQWLTVATSFVITQPRRFLFSRVGIRGVAAFLVLAYLALVWGAFGLSSVMLAQGEGLQNPFFDVMIMIVSFLFLGGLYLALRVFQPRKLKLMARGTRKGVAEAIKGKWISFWHTDDEWINAGRLIKEVQFRPFKRDFASPAFAYLSILFLPLMIYLLADEKLYFQLANSISSWIPSFEPAPSCLASVVEGEVGCADPFKSFARNSLAIVTWPSLFVFRGVEAMGISAADDVAFNHSLVSGVLLVGAFIGFALIWLFGILWHQIILISSRTISFLLSKFLNRLTENQLIRIGYGSDTHGEHAVNAEVSPAWLGYQHPNLPFELEQEISDSANEATMESLQKFRTGLSFLSFAKEDVAPSDLATSYLTWRELVHTTYFHIPKFRKLLAYGIAVQGGFSPTEEFLSDPDYQTVKAWYEQLKQ